MYTYFLFILYLSFDVLDPFFISWSYHRGSYVHEDPVPICLAFLMRSYNAVLGSPLYYFFLCSNYFIDTSFLKSSTVNDHISEPYSMIGISILSNYPLFISLSSSSYLTIPFLYSLHNPFWSITVTVLLTT